MVLPLNEANVVGFVLQEARRGRILTLFELQFKLQPLMGYVDGKVVANIVSSAAEKGLVSIEYSSKLNGRYVKAPK